MAVGWLRQGGGPALALTLLCVPARAAQPVNLTARLQQAVMDAAIRETSTLLRDPASRDGALRTLWFSEYKNVDRWLAGAPGRFADYNGLARQSARSLGRHPLPPALKKTARQAWLNAYDFSGEIGPAAAPGALARAWTHHEQLLRDFPEKLFLARQLKPLPGREKPCTAALMRFLVPPTPAAPATGASTPANNLFVEAGRLSAACMSP